MTEKRWIKIHTGLTRDPRHRRIMGNRVWLFMWFVDHADWETGIVFDFTDREAAEDMEVSSRTIEDQRQQLEKDGYIVCHQGFQCQHIRIMRWRNPHEVEADQINVPELREAWYDIHRTHPRRKYRTRTYSHT